MQENLNSLNELTLSQLVISLTDYKLEQSGMSNKTVTGICVDSRKMQPGNIFVALKGEKSDSHDFISQVLTAKPVAIVVSQDFETKPYYSQNQETVFIKAQDTRVALNQLASTFYSHPSRKMFCFAVTGTNGKTSTTYFIEHILNQHNYPTAVIGTIQHRLQDHIWNTEMTTPDSLQLMQRLFEMQNLGARGLAMEVSSHALQQGRADSVEFNTVIFTNLTRDHLDYHKTMENYFFAKQKLFTDLLWSSSKRAKFAIVNTDDSYGKKLQVAGTAEVITYGENKDAVFKFKITKQLYDSTEFSLNSPFGEKPCRLPVVGRHMVYNAVAAIAAVISVGVSIDQSVKYLDTFPGVEGRMQLVPTGKSIFAFVDYAHTPDALEKVLNTLNEIRRSQFEGKPAREVRNKIITVFGCGGDRDKGKRPIMAQIAEKNSDIVIVTSDNPRTEDPNDIINEIKKGFSDSQKIFTEVDRMMAIKQALQKAEPGDVVLVAGKGHENYQIIGTEKRDFSDFKTIQEYAK